ncbi:FkbM family methyltransferase [Fodinicurvata halophila]|uniref:FkbM family methyltransferase n=1 Tax=Fodinicurvata halophila TaxID=1419723 RepID=UPI00362B9FF8
MSRLRPTHITGFLRSLAIYHAVPGRARREKALLRHLVASGDLCFDIGAHAGNRTRSLMQLGARVIAVEPQPLFSGFLRWFFRARKDAVTVLPLALGAACGRAELKISPANPTTSTLSQDFVTSARQTDGFRNIRWTERIAVDQTTLDRLIEDHGRPRYCKIDVEGHEADVLAGLSTPLPVISVEYLGKSPSSAVQALARLQELGDYLYNAAPGKA